MISMRLTTCKTSTTLMLWVTITYLLEEVLNHLNKTLTLLKNLL